MMTAGLFMGKSIGISVIGLVMRRKECATGRRKFCGAPPMEVV
jgi:hypothetical protein